MSNISEDFLKKPKEEQQEIINNLVPSICTAFCKRNSCEGCFIHELTDAAT